MQRANRYTAYGEVFRTLSSLPYELVGTQAVGRIGDVMFSSWVSMYWKTGEDTG